MIIVYLDRRLPFANNMSRRLLIQISTTVGAALLTIIILTVILHYTFKGGPIPTEFFTYDLLIISVWFLIINSVYIGLNFYRKWQAAEQDRKDSRLKAGGIKVRSGNQERLVMYQNISGFTVEESYIVCFTLDGKKYVLDQSMDKLEKSLPAILFFRINRQFLLQRQVISGFERSANGKLDILLLPDCPFPSPVNLSRTRAAAFKQWFHSTS
jgi:DNA-binding LytR/AlgR family response regulator